MRNYSILTVDSDSLDFQLTERDFLEDLNAPAYKIASFKAVDLPLIKYVNAVNINQVLESESKVNPYKIDKNDFSIKTIKVSDIVKITKELLKDKP
jgi:sialic acid synthase SpsE